MNLRSLSRRNFLLRVGLGSLSFGLLSQYTHKVKASVTEQFPSVIILGAGLSGLYAALLLETLGFQVTVLEGRNRVGGRVLTLDDLPGKPEAGAQSLNQQYSRLMGLANRYNIPTEPLSISFSPPLLYVNGQSILPEQWESSEANHLTDLERQILPLALMSHYLRPNNH